MAKGNFIHMIVRIRQMENKGGEYCDGGRKNVIGCVKNVLMHETQDVPSGYDIVGNV